MTNVAAFFTLYGAAAIAVWSGVNVQYCSKRCFLYSFDGILVFGLLFICTCAYLKKVPRINSWLLSEKKGVWGVFYKAAIIGTRLHIAVAMSCLTMAFYVVFLK